MNGKLACVCIGVIFVDGGDPEECINMVVLVVCRWLVCGLPGVKGLPQGDGA